MTRAAVVVTTVLLLLVSATPILFSINDDNVNVTGTPDPSEIEIHTLDQLLLIGNNDEYPLSANYVQKDNIDFEDGDYNGGFNIDTKVTIQKNSIDDTKYDITISLHYSDTEQSATITPIYPALISLNGTIKDIASGNMKATFTFPSDELPDTLEISAGGIASNIPDDAWTDADKKTDNNFAIACSLTGITTATEEREYTSNSNGNFTPIGSYSEPFTGTYDGGGFTINNLKTAVFSLGAAYSGMFGYISSTNVELKGIGLTNNASIVIASTDNPTNVCSGGLVGRIFVSDGGTGTIQDCYTTGNNTATTSSSSYGVSVFSGGLVGYVNANSGTVTIQDCYTTCNITATASSSPYGISVFSGGLVGHIYASSDSTVTIQNCYTTCNITATASSSDYEARTHLGGLVGYINMNGTVTIQDCYTTGNITATSSAQTTVRAYSGGLVGLISANGTVTIKNCYITGNVIAIATLDYVAVYSGGLVGLISAVDGSTTVTIQNCYATGNIATTASSSDYAEAHSGGLVGFIGADSSSTVTIQDCYTAGKITADVTGEGSIIIAKGGIVGNLLDGTFYIYNCYYLSEDEINKELKIYGSKYNATVYIDGIVSTDGTSGRTEKPSGGRTLEDLQKKETYYDEETIIPGSDPEVKISGWIFYDPNNTEKECVWFIDEKIDENDTREPNERFNNGLPVLTTIEYRMLIQPKDVISNNVADNTFSVKSSIEGTYQWYYSVNNDPLTLEEDGSWIPIPNATSNEYKTSDDNDIDNFYNFYRCIVTITPKQKIISDSAQLLMGNATNITINVDGKGTVSYNEEEITISKTYTGPSDINVPMIFTIVPDKHNTLESVEFNGKDITLETKGDNIYIIFLMIKDNTLNVVFTEDQYNISISDDIVNGEISLEDNITSITNSETCEITITPDTGYVLKDIWIVQDEDDEDGDPKTAILTEINETTYKLSNVTDDCTINATFVLANYTIKVSDQIANGSVSSSMSTMTYNDTATITITPNDSYELKSISCDNNGTLTPINDTKYKLSNVTGDCTITATFVLKNYNVSITESDNGSVTSSTNTMTYEDTATITITPNDGYELESISCGNNGTLTKINDTTYELSEVTDDCTITATFKIITIPDEEPIDEGDGNGYDIKTIFAMMYISLVLIMLIAVVLGLTKP